MVIIGPLVTPERGLVKKLENVRMKIGQTQMNAGTLYITEKYDWQTFSIDLIGLFNHREALTISFVMFSFMFDFS